MIFLISHNDITDTVVINVKTIGRNSFCLISIIKEYNERRQRGTMVILKVMSVTGNKIQNKNLF